MHRAAQVARLTFADGLAAARAMHPRAIMRRTDLSTAPPEEGACPRGGSLEPHDQQEVVDETSDESFPASDPPSWTPVNHLETPRVPDEKLVPPT